MTKSHWVIDPEVTFLNHGSFGACPREILEHQNVLRLELEANPVQFFVSQYEPKMDSARKALADFVGVDHADLVFVVNATSGVNTILRSLPFHPEDELLVTDHEYNACRNTLDFVAKKSGARVVVATLPFPLESSEKAVQAIFEKVTKKTRLVLIDHVTSVSAIVLPLEKILPELHRAGIETLVDGAHAPGMLPLSISDLQPTYYTGNCHKWLLSPKGSAFLYVKKECQEKIVPLVISHGYNANRLDKSRFQLLFGYMGVIDPTPFLCIPNAIEFVKQQLPGGWNAWFAQNQTKVIQARRRIIQELRLLPACPESMLGSMASFALPPTTSEVSGPFDRLQADLYNEYKIQVPVWLWPKPPERVFRISAQAYNTAADYEKLIVALKSLL